MIEVQHLCKAFPTSRGASVTALEGVNLVVGAGEFITLTGPSGSGKSTLLFTIGAMLEPTEGSVLIGGENVYRQSPGRRAAMRRESIGFVFQTFNLVPYLSCVDNVAFVACLAGKSRRDARTEAEALLSRLGLGHRLEHAPGALSVGERQRAALARSLMNSPKVLLADEPTGNLDDATADEVMKLLLGQHHSGRTVLLATHDLTVAAQGSRMLSIDAGRITGDHTLRPAGGKVC